SVGVGRSSFGAPSWILEGYGAALAVRTLGGCGGRHGLPTIEAIDVRITAGKNSSDEVSHLVQVGVGKAHQEVIYNIRSRAGGGQHHFRSLPQITQHDGALRADDLGP